MAILGNIFTDKRVPCPRQRKRMPLMHRKPTIRSDKGQDRRLAVALFVAILSAMALFSWWIAARTDCRMREDLLRQAESVAASVNPDRVKTLKGTNADFANPDYEQITQQITDVNLANRGWRWLYLMGQNQQSAATTTRTKGSVFFYLDSIPESSEDHSLPGEIYADAPDSFHRVFQTGQPAVEGPYKDRWGVWVSAAVPLSDPVTHAVVAVLGIDIEAGAWKWDVAARVAPPIGLALAALIALFAVFVFARRGNASAKPVLQRLLPPLSLMILLLFAGAGVLLWHQSRQAQAGAIAADTSDVLNDLHAALDQQSAGLIAATHPIAADANVKRFLREGDAKGLLAAWRPVFETLRRESDVTHFYFLDKRRVCLLRIHQPQRRGDLINRFTARQAEETGKVASGVELGPLGTFTLRVVQPIYDGGSLVGYVELGKEIEDILQTLRTRTGNHLAVTIHKDLLVRKAWEDGMRLLGRKADWDRLSRSVVVFASQGRLPDAFAAAAESGGSESKGGRKSQEIVFEKKDWRVSTTSLQDASGKDVGNLLVMRDATSEKAAFARLAALGGAAGAVLLAMLLGFIYVLLRRTDAGMRAQQAELRESEERLSATLRSIGDGVIACDAEGNVVSLNAVAETLTGWSADEAKGRAIDEVFRIIHAGTRQKAEIPVARALREDRILGLANQTALIARDGTERQIADSCAPIHGMAGAVIGSVLVFRDVSEEHLQRERLRESEEKNRLLVEHAVSAIATYEVNRDASGQAMEFILMSANLAFEKHTGTARGRHAWPSHHPDTAGH